MKQAILIMLISLASAGLIGGCTDAEIVSKNISNDADYFRIQRRVVFYNSITDTYMLSIEGRCSVDFYTDKFTVTCKIGEDKYIKHYLGRSDNTLPFVEQIEAAGVDPYHYKVRFRPQAIIPDVEVLHN